MATAYTSLLGLALPVTGELSGSWGDVVNDSITSLLDSSISGATTLSSDADVTLTTTDGVANQARQAILLWTANGTVTRNITAPARSKAYFVINKTAGTQSIVIRGVGPTTGVTVLANTQSLVVWNGTDFVEIASGNVDGPASATDNAVTRFDGTTGKLVQNSAVTIDDSGNVSGVVQLNATTVDATNVEVTNIKAKDGTAAVQIADSTGVVSVTAAPVLTALTASQAVFTNGSKALVSNAITGTGNVVMSTSPTLVTPALGTPSSGVLTNATGLPISTGVSGLGAGVALFLATPSSANLAAAVTDETGSGSLVFATSPTFVTPILGTPTSGTLTNATGLPISTGVSGLGAGVATFLATPSSANLAAAVTDETGTGALVFATSPTLVTPALGTPSALVGTNITGTAAGLTAGSVTTNANLTGAVTSVGNATSLGSFTSAQLSGALTDETGSGSAVFATSPTLVTPALGTPSSATLTNATGLPIATGVSGLGTGVATALAVNVGSAGAPVVNGGALGTPSSGTLTNATGLPISTGVSGLGTNVATFLATPSSANLAAAVTDETGSGALVFATSPTLVTPALGTPASGVVTNLTGTASININGTVGATTPAAGAFTTIAASGTTTLSGNQVISVTDNTNAALRITQLGTGNALLVEDSTNPDASPFVIDASGNVTIGATLPASGFGRLQVATSSAFASSLIQLDSDANPSILSFLKTRGAAPSTQTIVQSGDQVGQLRFYGSDGATYIRAAVISGEVDGTPGTNDMPGRLVFSTTADGASTPTERMRINAAGNVGIGSGISQADSNLTVNKNITGGTTSYGIRSLGTIQTDVTLGATLFQSNPATVASAFTLTALRHYQAAQGTIGAGSVITNQFGFIVENTTVGATNNFGFYGNIPSGTGRWNFYAAGTATNFFGGNTIVEVTDNTNAALRITQLGTGNALLVEDSTNPDATPFVVDALGYVVAGSTAALSSVALGFAKLEVIGNDNQSAQSAIWRFTADSDRARQVFYKSRSGTIGTNTVVQSGDFIGEIDFYGADGTNYIAAAAISGVVDGTPGTNDMPGRLVFSTTADGASTPTERMRIDSAGNVGIGVTPTTAAKTTIVNTSAGASTIALSLQNVSTTINSETVLDLVATTSGAGVRSAQISAINTNGSTGVNMVFKISNGAAPAEAMRIVGAGGLQIQTGVAVGAATPGTSGVAFPATAIAVADANTLDDYEEGTWTPVVTFSVSNGDTTTAEALGIYTKIGRLVQIAFNVEFTETTASGNLTITGVPFATGGSVRTNVGCWVDNMTALVGSPVAAINGGGATTIQLQQTVTGVAASITNTNTSTSSRVRGFIVYNI